MSRWRINRSALHDWVYTLWYPAILGTMIVGLIAGGQAPQVGVARWGEVLAFYFATQHSVSVGQGQRDAYRIGHFLRDVVETALIVLAFVGLGVFPERWSGIDAEALGAPDVMSGLLVVIFLLPPLYRLVFDRDQFKSARGWVLTALSAVAALVAGLGVGCWIAVAGVALVLITYVALFVLARPADA